MAHLELLFTKDLKAAEAELEGLGARITQTFTDAVFEASLPDDLGATALKASSAEPDFALDAASELVVAAWRSLSFKLEAAIKLEAAADIDEGLAWDTEGRLPPQHLDDAEWDEGAPRPEGAPFLESTGTPTSLYMTGSTAVGLVVVSGGGGLAFSQAEQIKVVQEVMEGLQFLANADAGANVSFRYSIRFVTITAPPPTSACTSYEGCEQVWRDPALVQMGYSAGYAGCQQYAAALKTQQGSDWSYVAFFTKYPQFHLAYAGGVRLCMQYDNDGWGPDNINKVFAHETCHIFGAADEYGSCSCGPSGQFNVPNNNCRNCTSNQVGCLMNANTLDLCGWSRGQIGWSYWTQQPGGLSNISVASDGTIWGVNAGGNIYKYVGGSAVWQQIPGGLSCISVGSATNIWGVNGAGDIYQYVGGSAGWQQIPGALSWISAAADGSVWGVNQGGAIYKYVGGAAVWQQVPGGLSCISVGSATNIWGVNSGGDIYRYVGGSAGWQQVPGGLSNISAAADGTVWGVNGRGDIYQYVGGAAVWRQVYGGLSCVAAGSADNVWGVNSGGNIYQRIKLMT